MRSLPAVLLLLSACEDAPETCPTFEDLRVTNPDGAAPEGVIEEVQSAVDVFAGWMVWAGVCVGELRLVDEIVRDDGTDPAGVYHGAWIELEYNLPDIQKVAWHELCHAVDHELGWVSRTLPELFDPKDPVEDFAEKCSLGPQELSLVDGLESVCGIDLGGNVWRWLNVVVFTAADLPYDPPRGTVPITLERQAVQGLPENWSWWVIPGGESVYFEGENAKGEPRLFRVDTETASVVGELAIPTFAGRHELLASNGEPLLVTWGETTSAWRVDNVAGAFMPVLFPALGAGTSLQGVVLGDEAWILTESDTSGQAFWRVDLSTGEDEPVDLPEGYELGWVYLDGDALWASGHDQDHERVFLHFDPSDWSWTVESHLIGLSHALRLTLPDGRSLVTYYHEDREDFPESVMGLAVEDPALDAWWLADTPCTEDRLAFTWEFLSIGGEPWLWEFPNGWIDEQDPWFGQQVLTRVVVGE